MHELREPHPGEDSPDHHVSNGWVLALCSVVFDVDQGQKVEAVYPEDALTASEQEDVAFSSFPVS